MCCIVSFAGNRKIVYCERYSINKELCLYYFVTKQSNQQSIVCKIQTHT